MKQEAKENRACVPTVSFQGMSQWSKVLPLGPTSPGVPPLWTCFGRQSEFKPQHASTYNVGKKELRDENCSMP